ncbi:hypothetical protein KZZ52_14345 [Dactylosporangium sp. AC04546]|uniref:hypothetical protein n=1 Tax=Dactylosporangium sp. AC04546 TaxID=2862460 RepID=UPI001EE10068|nr:hypothetical protein [Dactylosporangium sp. AC04546]WVK86499.1 hypothetical protein KZZ52_14345 [Dactylosporangium sp. AC04546]
MTSDRRAVTDRLRRSAGVLTLCTVLVAGAAACTPGEDGAAGPAPAGSSPSPGAVPATESPTAPASAEAQAAQASGAPATPAATRTTGPGKPPAQTTAPAQGGGHVTSASIKLLQNRSGEPGDWCTSRTDAVVEFRLVFDGPGTASILVRNSDGLSSAIRDLRSLRGESLGGGGHYAISISKDQLHRTVQFWVEVTSPNRITSPRATFTVDCAGFVDR